MSSQKNSQSSKSRAKPLSAISAKRNELAKSSEMIESTDDADSDAPDSTDESLETTPIDNSSYLKAKESISSSAISGNSEDASSGEDDSEEDTGSNNISTMKVNSRAFLDSNSDLANSASKNRRESFNPPNGFEAASINGQLKFSELFQDPSIEKKQVYYFTAPASVPVNEIEQITLSDMENGKIIYSKNDNHYAFMLDVADERSTTKLLLPRNSDQAYCLDSRPIDKVLYLQQVLELPNAIKASDNVEAGGESRGTSFKKPVRQQPPGLKMRYLPIGFGEGKTGEIGQNPKSKVPENLPYDSPSPSSDIEMNDAQQLPATSAAISKSNGTSSKKHSKSSSRTAEGSLKRKNTNSGGSNTHNSSSILPISVTDVTALKNLKKQHANPLKTTTEGQSVSNEPRQSYSSVPLPRALNPSSKYGSADTTPAEYRRSESIITPPSSSAETALTEETSSPGALTPCRQHNLSHQGKLKVGKAFKGGLRKISSSKSVGRGSQSTLRERIAALSASLTEEERNGEIKRLIRNENSRLSKARNRAKRSANAISFEDYDEAYEA